MRRNGEWRNFVRIAFLHQLLCCRSSEPLNRPAGVPCEAIGGIDRFSDKARTSEVDARSIEAQSSFAPGYGGVGKPVQRLMLKRCSDAPFDRRVHFDFTQRVVVVEQNVPRRFGRDRFARSTGLKAKLERPLLLIWMPSEILKQSKAIDAFERSAPQPQLVGR